ncbi:MAG: hypothetical protein H7328_10985 [Bdellovibrio sp.]|nr:hypothetical protein [Bdellovibrio sp.]
MKKILAFCGVLTMTLGITAQAAAPTVSNAKAIELSAHRIDRLVTLSKIDASFLSKLAKLEVTVVQNQAPVYYKVKVTQGQPAQGQPMQVDISFDADGKPLSFQVIAGGVAGPDAGWTDKDAGSLAENALHYILENSTAGKVPLFDKSATSLTLSKQTLNGQIVARGQVLSSATTEKLNIYLKLDGTFISAEVVP